MNKKKLSSVLLASTLATSAQAALISGNIGFAGVVILDAPIGVANALDFQPGTAVLTGIGDFAAEVPGTAVFADFVFDPFPGGGVVPQWTLASGNYSFDLLSVSIDAQNSTFLNLTGTGTIHDTNPSDGTLDDTPGLWSLTATDTSGGTRLKVTFAADTTAVPEESNTMLLMGMGLVGIGLAARRQR